MRQARHTQTKLAADWAKGSQSTREEPTREVIHALSHLHVLFVDRALGHALRKIHQVLEQAASRVHHGVDHLLDEVALALRLLATERGVGVPADLPGDEVVNALGHRCPRARGAHDEVLLVVLCDGGLLVLGELVHELLDGGCQVVVAILGEEDADV